MKVAIGESAGGDGDRHPDVGDLLDDPHCQSLLECLRRADDAVPESTLARRVVAGVTGTAPEDVPEHVERRVGTWLHHGQLPALESAGIVDFDADAGEVRLADG